MDLQREIRGYFANRCAYCHTAESLTIAIFEFEHIVPRVAGGQTVFSNLCLSCPTCNRYKGTRRTATDPESAQEVPLFHPHRQIWRDHFAWSSNGTAIIGLTPTGRATIVALQMNRPQLVRVRQMWAAMGEHPPSLDL